ncbi:uncharacterized protein LOC110186331 [Drosophila serrata]|uniref:uncharacterized protein LOC110186331 n=1 Tax=Drosophila serrata TaxID=7274 RepID=UPI000A1D1434|nr:uncharacterized protein LOC110186331 [Drosophila serrata]
MRSQGIIWPLACCLWLLLLLPLRIRSQCVDTGEPGCRHPAEVGIPQRYCLDPTKYWLCSALGLTAALRKCQANTGFDQDLNACVPWPAWVWQPCIEPPSRPPGFIPC